MVEEAAYDARQIQVLEGLQAVRKRPAMFVGSVDARGLHHLVHELVLSRMHSGGKFERKMYRVSGGLHGVGLSVVNGLSEWLEVRVRRDAKEYRMRFARGQKASNLEVVGPAEGTGTIITFRPDPEVFETIEFDYDTLAKRLRGGG